LIGQEETADLKVAETLRARRCLDKSDTKRLNEAVKKLEETKMKTLTQHLMKRGTNGPNCKEAMYVNSHNENTNTTRCSGHKASRDDQIKEVCSRD
jgi:hypothetical protein